jgi:hypothetical protein
MADKYDPAAQLTPAPWLDSNIIKGLLTALAALAGTIGTIFFGLDESIFNEKAEKIITALVAFLAVAAPIGFAIWARTRQATPPLTTSRAAAETKTEEMKQAGVLPETKP